MKGAFMNEEFLNRYGQLAITAGLRILVVVALTLFALFLGKILTRKLGKHWEKGDEESRKRAQTLTDIIWLGIKIVIFILASLMVLSQLGIKMGPLLATAGLGGLAIGFGAQTLVKDILSGFFLILENQIRIGDVVEVANKSGVVEKITLRMVTLRDLAGNVHMIPHSSIDKVTNMTRSYSYYVFNIGVAYKENTDEVIKILKEVDEEIRSDSQWNPKILEPLEVLGVDKFADSAVILKARIKTLPIHQWSIGREMNRRIKIAFDKKGIEIPYPHQTIFFGNSPNS